MKYPRDTDSTRATRRCQESSDSAPAREPSESSALWLAKHGWQTRQTNADKVEHFFSCLAFRTCRQFPQTICHRSDWIETSIGRSIPYLIPSCQDCARSLPDPNVLEVCIPDTCMVHQHGASWQGSKRNPIEKLPWIDQGLEKPLHMANH